MIHVRVGKLNHALSVAAQSTKPVHLVAKSAPQRRDISLTNAIIAQKTTKESSYTSAPLGVSKSTRKIEPAEESRFRAPTWKEVGRRDRNGSG